MGLQDDSWQMSGQLGKGCTGSVMATNSLLYPNVVLKRGPGGSIKAEAERLWQLRHPSVVQVYAVLDSDDETEEGEPIKYMALARLGASLQSMLVESSKRCALCCLTLRLQCPRSGWIPVMRTSCLSLRHQLLAGFYKGE